MSDVATVAVQGTELTSFELRALIARAEADSDQEAAARLGCSVHTLRSHLKNARSRLGVHSTGRAIQIALVSPHMAVAAPDHRS